MNFETLRDPNGTYTRSGQMVAHVDSRYHMWYAAITLNGYKERQQWARAYIREFIEVQTLPITKDEALELLDFIRQRAGVL